MQPSDFLSRIRPRRAKASASRGLARRLDTLAAASGDHARLLQRPDALDRRLTLIQRAVQALILPEGQPGDAPPRASHGKADAGANWEAFYAAFEDRF